MVILDHIIFQVRDTQRAKTFYLACLKPLGIELIYEVKGYVGLGRAGNPAFWFGPGEGPISPVHVAFCAENNEQVEAFHRAGLAAGGKDNGTPGIRAHYHPKYYAAFVLDPEGNNIEAVCHNGATG